MAAEVHQGFDIAGEPSTHQGPQASCWDPACERVENYLTPDDTADINYCLAAVLENQEPS